MTPSGVINLDKPAGLSSARAVSRVKRLLPKGTKIGHAGTLDPFATGVLLLLVGKATKACESLMSSPKRYEATLKLGSTTPTDDPESEETAFEGGTVPTMEQIVGVIPRFTGAILQQPPIFSALKVGGRRAYDLARSGEKVVLQPRVVQVYSIEVLGYEYPYLSLRIDCGRGTYIRSIAREMGAALGAGGHLSQLRRTRVGPFEIAEAATLELLTSENLPLYAVPHFPPPPLSL